MITQKQFVNFIKLITDIEDRENQFEEDIQKFAQDKDFTGFHSNLVAELVDWLRDLFDDEADYIGWWLWDVPDRGKAERDKCCIYATDKKSTEKEYYIKTPEDLYNFLMGISK